MPVAGVPRERVLAFRLAAQRLSLPAGGPLEVAQSWGLQDSPPGAAAMALHARNPSAPTGTLERALDLRTLVRLYNARTATAVVPAREAASFGAALLPAGEEELRVLLATALPKDGISPSEAVRRAGEAMLEVLDGRVLSRDDLHEALRRRLPEALLPWCPGCRSHHVRRGLLVVACLRGELCLAGQAGRQPAFARPDQWLGERVPRPPADEALADLARRYLRAHGPSTPAHMAAWAGVPRSHAARGFGLIADETVAIERHGRLLQADAAAFEHPPPHRGVTLLGPGDPLLLSRDRELLLPDPAMRRAVWRAINAPGAVLADGEIAGVWRARRRGGSLELTVEPFWPLDEPALDAAAGCVAAARGAGKRAAAVRVITTGG